MPDEARHWFQCRAKPGSYGDLVFRYLKSGEPVLNEQELVRLPLLAYWLPAAVRDYFQLSEAEVKRAARHAVYLLELQKLYLMYEYGIELPLSDAAMPAAARGEAGGATQERQEQTGGAEPDPIEEAKQLAQQDGNDDWMKNTFGG